MIQEQLLKALRVVHQLENDQAITIDNLEDKVSAASGVRLDLILQESKRHYGMCLRWVLYHLYRKQGLSYPAIARRTGRPEHTIVRHGVLQLQKYLRRYEDDERVTGIESSED